MTNLPKAIQEEFEKKFYEGEENAVSCKEHNTFATPFEILTFLEKVYAIGHKDGYIAEKDEIYEKAYEAGRKAKGSSFREGYEAGLREGRLENPKILNEVARRANEDQKNTYELALKSKEDYNQGFKDGRNEALDEIVGELEGILNETNWIEEPKSAYGKLQDFITKAKEMKG